MKRQQHIVLLDPGLKDNAGNPSDNLGDLIISESNQLVLADMFPGKEIIRVSTHQFLGKKQMRLINGSAFCFVGGTNLLHSNMLRSRIFMMRRGRLLWLFPGISKLVLLGAGWGFDYKDDVTFRTRLLYKKILHPGFRHSVRDSFTAEKLEDCSQRDTITTTCASMWKLNGLSGNLEQLPGTCLFTLTDYNQDRIADNALLLQLLERFSRLIFFPQGTGDLAYLFSLDQYKQNKDRIDLLPHDYAAFKRFLKKEDFLYIGTRLHAGIKCLDEGKKGLILGIDNRARAIAKDSFLPVTDRENRVIITEWLDGKQVFKEPVRIPLDMITKWKAQFK